MSLSTPVVLIIYRRPALLRQVVERVAEADPKTLLVIADGPRSNDEQAVCEEARDVVRRVSWTGEVRWNIADRNMGLRRRVSSGLDWVFSQAERAIILEDDCLPEPTFFPFCEELLERYHADERIMQIAGSSLTGGALGIDESYYFSRYYHPWGWASWRRAWSHYDVDISRWPEIRRRGGFRFGSRLERRFWTTVFDRLYAGDFDTWDYQWLFAMLRQSGMCLVPRENLVRNIGFGPGGTHYTGDHRFARMTTGALGSLEHPLDVIHHAAADRAEFAAAGRPWVRLARVELGRYRYRVQQLATSREPWTADNRRGP